MLSFFFLREPIRLCFGYVLGGVCPLLWRCLRHVSVRSTPHATHRAKSTRGKKGETCKLQQLVLCLDMGKLKQIHRNAIVMWASPVKNGLQPQGGHGLTNTQILGKLKRVFNVKVTFCTPLEYRCKICALKAVCFCETETLRAVGLSFSLKASSCRVELASFPLFSRVDFAR